MSSVIHSFRDEEGYSYQLLAHTAVSFITDMQKHLANKLETPYSDGFTEPRNLAS